MDESLYKTLVFTAIFLALFFVGWSFYDSFIAEKKPGDLDFLTGDQFFADGDYQSALSSYHEALTEDPNHIPAIRGVARTLMQLERNDEAMEFFNRAIRMDPNAGATYANRGILHDRIGEYRLAIADYEKALQLDQELTEGPHWLTRFLRLQPEKPPTIADRANYLKQELAKPESERVLRVKEEDEAQRSYKH